jgi:hypothetical protein
VWSRPCLKVGSARAGLSASPAHTWPPSRLLPGPRLHAAALTVERPRPADGLPAQVSLPLDFSRSAVYVVHHCCGTSYWPTQRRVSTDVRIVVHSSISVSFVLSGAVATAWVTDASAEGAGAPVGGATVWVLATRYNQDTATLLGKCTTDVADGTCRVTLPQPDPSNPGNLVGVARRCAPGRRPLTPSCGSSPHPPQAPCLAPAPAPHVSPLPPIASPVCSARRGRDVSIVPSLGYYSSYSSPPPDAAAPTLLGSLVLDRALVRPNDTLHITGGRRVGPEERQRGLPGMHAWMHRGLGSLRHAGRGSSSHPPRCRPGPAPPHPPPPCRLPAAAQRQRAGPARRRDLGRHPDQPQLGPRQPQQPAGRARRGGAAEEGRPCPAPARPPPTPGARP